MRGVTAFASVVVLLASTSCISHKPVRTFDDLQPFADRPFAYCPVPIPPSVSTSVEQLQEEGLTGDKHREDVSCAAQETHASVVNSPTSLPHAGFDLHVLEFDDEGRPWNIERQYRTFDELRKELHEQPSVVVTFVHGWKNDASVCNGNLSCFREVLEILAKAEMAFAEMSQTTPKPRPPRRVIGIYIGWRGGSTDLPLLKETTFWGRKHTAHVVGDNGGVTAVIERLRTTVEQARCPVDKRVRDPRTSFFVCPPGDAFEMTSLVFVGHSFGAALLYSAIATSLNGAVGAAMQQALGGPVQVARTPDRQRGVQQQPVVADEIAVRVPSGGDLVVLVNPAMEASRFANLNAVRNLQFVPEQVPIFMTVASEGDGPVGSFFPIGQSIATVARSARTREVWLSMVKGFGLYEPYHTHRLVLKPGDVPLPERREGRCRCPENLRAFGDALVTRLKALYQALQQNQAPPPVAQLRLASYQEMMFSRLEPIRDVHPYNPFVMATMDTRIVSGHSDIFNPRLIDFLIEYVLRSEIKRGLVGDYVRSPMP
jgi:hypothetical protein